MRRWLAYVTVSAVLSIGCVPTQVVIPDPHYPHPVAEEAEVVIWARLPSGKFVKTKVRILPGWYVAGPLAIEDGR